MAAAIYAALDDAVELILGDTVDALDDDGKRVRVTFASGRVSDFGRSMAGRRDLVRASTMCVA